jgi:hypothetical protein
VRCRWARGVGGWEGFFCFFFYYYYFFIADKRPKVQGRPRESGLGFLMLFFFVNYLAKADKEHVGSQSGAMRSQKFFIFLYFLFFVLIACFIIFLFKDPQGKCMYDMKPEDLGMVF